MSSSDQGRYAAQDRGNRTEYEAYFAGMDKSMQQKVALTTAHFPSRGRIADMGSGSGKGTFDLACLYAGLEVIGVDINPTSVQISSEQYLKSNLRYVVGDIADRVFPPASLDGILDSSVLHHVTSFNNFSVQRVMETLDNQCAQLKTGGVLIIRDFVVPDGPEQVFLDLPCNDGSQEGAPSGLSTAALFERFAREWRSSLNPDGPLEYHRLESPRDGFTRFKTTLRVAAEFVLRKDYRDHWAVEILEEYTYLNQSRFEQAFRERGMRIITSMPIWNPWIVEHRFENKFHIEDASGIELPYPPTNYLIVGDKVEDGAGVEIVEVGRKNLSTPRFLQLNGYRDRRTGHVFELAERPNATLDVLPWYEVEDQVFVLAKKDFPRPILNASPEQSDLNGSFLSGYITEPISAIIPAQKEPEEAVREILHTRASVGPAEILGIDAPAAYFTSPGGIDERVISYRVQIQSRQGAYVPFENYTPFHSAGTVREMDACQTLRASQVGGMFDARLEINIYLLLRAIGKSRGPWIGAEIALTQQDVSRATDPQALTPPAASVFERCEIPGEPSFLALREGTFEERDRLGNVLSSVAFEYVEPAQLSKNTVSAIPVALTSSGILIGVEHRHLPAVQRHSGSSHIATVPAWRLPFSVTHRSRLPGFVRNAVPREFGPAVRRVWELGGPYFATPGVTPEYVFPYAVEMDAASMDSRLHLVEARELKEQLDRIQDAHLLLSACRILHALGV